MKALGRRLPEIRLTAQVLLCRRDVRFRHVRETCVFFELEGLGAHHVGRSSDLDWRGVGIVRLVFRR